MIFDTVSNCHYDKKYSEMFFYYRKSDELDYSESTSLKGQRKDQKMVSVLPIMFKAFGGQFLISVVLKLCNDLLIFAAPELLR